MMCSDPYGMELPLQPFLNEPSFVVTSDPETSSMSPEDDNVFTIDVNLDCQKQKVEVTVTSYHGAHLLLQKQYIYHGYILVYCPKRRASLASLKAFADTRSPALKMFLAVPAGDGRKYNINDHSHGLKEGKELAKNHKAAFVQYSNNFKTQPASVVFERFFRDVWDHREEVETYSDERIPPPAYELNYQRPPAPLPNQYHPNKSTSSNSQSTEDSEPLYDQPHLLPAHSDSERASSPSPPALPSSSPPMEPASTPVFRNDNELVKPSMLKENRNKFAGKDKDQFRKSFPVTETEFTKMRTGMSQSVTDHLNTETHSLIPYLCRKSTSMKFAVKDEPEVWAINEKRQSTKSSTYPAINSRSSTHTHDSLFESRDDDQDVEWTQNETYNSTPYRSVSKHKQKPSDTRTGRIQAPLAVAERIEIAEMYGTVKDAIPGENSDYARVDDALPHGKIHRIKSQKEEKHVPGTDSEESECSSLERDKGKDLYSKVNRKPTPGKKKHKQRGVEGTYVTHINIDHRRLSDQERLHDIEHGSRGRSNSPSEDSAGTGDELQTGSRPKRRSVKKKGAQSGNSAFYLSDNDAQGGASSGVVITEDEDSILSTDSTIKGGGEDSELSLNESGSFATLFRKKGIDKSQKTLERRTKDEEKRKLRENEKKQKEQQKLQKKIKKKDSKAAGQSESGTSLSDFPMSPNNPSVPHFIEKCVEFIEEEGLHAEGIYRIPGNKAQVDLLTTKYNEDSNVDISTLEIQVNAVATVLKAFFADLTDPLVPVHMYDALKEASGVQDKSARVAALREVFLRMHPLNYEVLKFLITHLHKVSMNSEHNSMDSKNLSRCWWPTLFRMHFESFDIMKNFSRIPEEILQTLIEQCSFFFHSGNEI